MRCDKSNRSLPKQNRPQRAQRVTGGNAGTAVGSAKAKRRKSRVPSAPFDAQNVSKTLILSLHERGLWFTSRENEIELPNPFDEDWSDFIEVMDGGRSIQWSGAYGEPLATDDRQVERLAQFCSSWRCGLFTLDHLGDKCCWNALVTLKSAPDIQHIRSLVQWIAIEGEVLRKAVRHAVSSDEPIEDLIADARQETLRLFCEHVSACNHPHIILDNWPSL